MRAACLLFAVASASAAAAPAPPAPIAVTPGDKEAWVEWGPSAGATGYNVYSANGGAYTQIAANLKTLAFLQTGLTDGVDYSFYATAVDASGESLPSLMIDATPNIPANFLPVFTASSVTNGASFAPGAVPGSIVTIFGTNLLTNTNGIHTAQQVPLPTTIANTSVLVGGLLAPLFAADRNNNTGQEQINLQIPWEFAGHSSVPVVVNNGTTISASVTVPLAAAQPGVFILDSANDGFLHGDYAVVNAARPAQPGEEILAYLTGLGAVTATPSSGSVGSANTSTTPVVQIGSLNATVDFSGLAPGFVGLYQVNFTVPPTTPSGTQSVVVAIGGTAAAAASLPVQ